MALLIAILVMAVPASTLTMKGDDSKPSTNLVSVQEVSPLMMGILGSAVLIVILAIFFISRSRSEGYKAFGDKSGLSTSSSDITSSETGSTDRELKSRMERFEKRLEEHKKMLESKGDESSSVTDSDSKVSSSNGAWMKK